MASLLFGLGVMFAAAGPVPNREVAFDSDWRFLCGDAPGAEQPTFADSAWRKLDVPHDWSIEDLPKPTNALPTLVVARGTWRFARGDDMARAAASFDDSAWPEVRLPAYWNDHSGYTNEHCFGWYRRLVEVPATMSGKDFLLNVGVVDDADETFFNAEKIGGLGGMPPSYDGSKQPWSRPRIYRVPAALVRSGQNVVAVRVYNEGAKGGLCGEAFEPVGPFSPDSPGGASTGYFLGGTGWYRKHFTLDAASAGRLVSVVFDGVYMDADVWLNGQHLGNHPYGYTPFAFNLTPHLRPPSETNILAVRVRNLGKNSRWYSGSGIYRHVTLTVTDPLHIPPWSVYVTTPKVTKASATVTVVTTVENAGNNAAAVVLRTRLIGPNGKAGKPVESTARVRIWVRGSLTEPRSRFAQTVVPGEAAALPRRGGGVGGREGD